MTKDEERIRELESVLRAIAREMDYWQIHKCHSSIVVFRWVKRKCEKGLKV